MLFTCRIRVELGEAGERDSQSKREMVQNAWINHQSYRVFIFSASHFRDTQSISEMVQLQLPQAPAQMRT